MWKGKYGNQAQLDTYNDYTDGLHGDGHAIWPGGFNYDPEDGVIQRFWHTRIMAGIRADMGILSYTREARNDAVVVGGTAEFRVESPLATAWQWSKDGVALTSGGDISGASTATLRIANADATDVGSYRCAATGAAETLTSRPRQLWVHAAPQLGQWNFNGNARQRIFDFGSGTYQYFFLSPKSDSSTLRLAIKDTINGKDVEYQVNAPVLAIGQWVHVAAVIKGSYMTLYVNGQAASSEKPYVGQALAPFASDADLNPLTFAKLNGPAWLTVASNGTLSGQPTAGDGGENTFIVRVTDPSGASSDATLKIGIFAPLAAPVTSSLTAPDTDADDAYFLASNIGEPDTIGGTSTALDNDESTYVAENRTSKGQTFTTGPSAHGYFLQSFTVQQVNWPTLTASGTAYDIQPGDQWEFQIGTLSGTTKTPLLKYSAGYDGTALTGGGS